MNSPDVIRVLNDLLRVLCRSLPAYLAEADKLKIEVEPLSGELPESLLDDAEVHAYLNDVIPASKDPAPATGRQSD